MTATVVLVHSPLTGPLVWSLVRESLQGRGITALVPVIPSHHNAAVYWQRDASGVASALEAVPTDEPLLLVAHSGAGLLLPAIRELVPNPVAGYVFVDAGIPIDGLSRLDLMRQESAGMANQLQTHLQSGGRFPEWNEADLREIVPDDRLRAALVADLRPQSLGFFNEPIPVVAWPDAPCAYIQLTPTYETFAGRARSAGWPVRQVQGGHFHMLVEPDEVANAIIKSGVPGALESDSATDECSAFHPQLMSAGQN